MHTRTQVLGLLLLAASSSMLIVAGLAAGIPLDDAAFLLGPISGTAIGAFLSWRFSTWAKAVGIVLGLGAGMMTFWLVFGLSTPASFVEFVAGVAFVLGILLTLGGGIAALVRRRDLRTEPTRAERLVERTASGLVGPALLVSVPMWFMARGSVSPAAAAGLSEATMSNFEFAGATTVAATDGEVSLVVRNTDAFFHTFTIDGVVDDGLDEDDMAGVLAIE